MAAGRAGDIRAGGAFVELFTKDTLLEKGLAEAKEKVAKLGEALVGIGEKLSLAGAAITAPFIEAAKTFAETGASLHDMSLRTGISAETLSTLGFVAKQSGTDIGMAEMAIRRMQRAILEAAEGLEEPKRAFDLLGISVENLFKMSPDEQFSAIAEAMNKIENPSAKAGVAMQLFGRSGTMLLPMLGNLKQLTAQAREFGLAWTDKEADKAKHLSDSFDLLHAVGSKLAATIGSALAPVLERLAVDVARVGKGMMDFAETHQELIVNITKTGVALVAAGAAFITLGLAVKTLAVAIGFATSVFTGFRVALSLLFIPITALPLQIGLVVAAMGAWTAYAMTSSRSISDSFGGISEVLGTLKEDAISAFQGIADALKAGDIALAAKILMSSLKVEWLKGTTELAKIWADWGIDIRQAFADISTSMASTWIDLMASLKSHSLSFMAWFHKNAPEHLANAFKKLAFFLPEGGLRQSIMKPPTEETIGGVETERQQQQAALASGAAIDQENRRKAADDAVKAAKQELEDARNALGKLKTETVGKASGAGEAALGAVAAAANEVMASKAKPGEEMTPEGLDKAMDKAKKEAKVDVAGSFSAAALRGLGAGVSTKDKIADDQLKEQKMTNAQLEKLNRKASVAQLVFQ